MLALATLVGVSRSSNPKAIDLGSFCRQALSLSGALPLTSLRRLASGFSALPDGDVSWSVQGSTVSVSGGAAETWLRLQASAVVPLQCQRCLQTMSEPLQVDRRMRFVRTEDEAARLDEELDDDVLVQPPRLDLFELLEDELILALPLVPRHTRCLEPLPMAQDDLTSAEADAPNPFAALAALRRNDDADRR